MFGRGVVRAVLVTVAVLGPLAISAQNAPSEKVQYVRVIGADYQFTAPTSITEGIVTFHLLNSGADVHQMSVMEIGIGHTVKEFYDAMHAKGVPPAWAVTVGSTSIIQKQTETFLTLRLPPGKFVLACLIPASDGRSHTEKGMYQAMNVTPLAPAKPTAPAASAAPAAPAKKP